MKRRIGIIPDEVARPLFNPFQAPEFDVSVGTPGELAMKLREDKLDGAFLSPVDASLHGAGCRLVPGTALVARGGSRTAHLVFREGLRTISTIAADPGRTAEIVLAHIVLVEKYDTTPRILPLRGDSTGALSGADAVLRAGDGARSSPDEMRRIDLVEEWEDISGLPFVHGLWFVRERMFAPGDIARFTAGAAAHEGESGTAVSYVFGEEARSGLAEFLKMAYYHGILKDIPEFRNLSDDIPPGVG